MIVHFNCVLHMEIYIPHIPKSIRCRQRGALPCLQRDQDLNPEWYRERGKVCTRATPGPDGWNADKVWHKRKTLSWTNSCYRKWGWGVIWEFHLLLAWETEWHKVEWAEAATGIECTCRPSVSRSLLSINLRDWTTEYPLLYLVLVSTLSRQRHNRVTCPPLATAAPAQDFNVWMNEGDMIARGDTVGKAVGTLSNLAAGVKTSDTGQERRFVICHFFSRRPGPEGWPTNTELCVAEAPFASVFFACLKSVKDSKSFQHRSLDPRYKAFAVLVLN